MSRRPRIQPKTDVGAPAWVCLGMALGIIVASVIFTGMIMAGALG